jgi:hypothetical protein
LPGVMARSVGLRWPQATAENARETLGVDGPKPAAASQGYREAPWLPRHAPEFGGAKCNKMPERRWAIQASSALPAWGPFPTNVRRLRPANTAAFTAWITARGSAR